MRLPIRMAIYVLAALLITLPWLGACGSDDDDNVEAPAATQDQLPTATAEPNLASEPATENQQTSWRYRATYADQEEMFSLNLMGEETVNGIDCYVIEATYDEPLARMAAGGSEVDVTGGKYWVAKTTLDEVKTEGSVTAIRVLDLDSVVTATYGAADHGAPLAVGKKWTVDRLTHLDPQAQPDSVITWSVEVAGRDEITVPAGTFDCYRLEFVAVAKDGIAIENPVPGKTEWWSVKEDLPVPIKVEDYVTFFRREIRELVPADYEPTAGGGSTGGTVESEYETSTAFHEMMDVILKQDRAFLEGPRAVKDEISVLEGYQWLTELLDVALDFYLWADMARPSWINITSPTMKWGGDNPDASYHVVMIDPKYSYRVRGKLGDSAYLSLTAYGGPSDGTWSSRIIDTLNNRDMQFNADGTFEIILSTDEQPGNWLKLEPDAVAVLSRDFMNHPETEQPTTLEIEVIGATLPPPRLTDAEVARRLRMTTTFLKDLCAISPGLVGEKTEYTTGLKNYVEKVESGPRFTVGWAAYDAAYAQGNFDLAEDEALVIEGRSPECVFWNMCLWNPYLQTYDYRYEQVGTNGGQVQYESDGSWRIVIAHSDPGVPNWVSTAGHRYGMIWFRWYLWESMPEQPQAKVVKLSDLK